MAWRRERGIAAAIPGRDDATAQRRRRLGRQINYGTQQREHYWGRNIVKRCLDNLQQRRGIAMRSDRIAWSPHAGNGRERPV